MPSIRFDRSHRSFELVAGSHRQGSNWARIALAVLYGGFGTLSLVFGPVTWLTEGGSLADAMAGVDLGSVPFAASRLLHLAAIITALILMFHPAANAYIREAGATDPREAEQRIDLE